MIFEKIIEKYRERYIISPIDMADSAETNRIHVLIFSPLLFLFGVIDIGVVLILHHDDLSEYLFSLFYYGFYTIVSTYCYIHAKLTKSVPRDKAYILKSMPAYVLVFCSFGAGVYNFYILNQPFNGVLTFCLTGFIALITFSMSPFTFLAFLSIFMVLLVPGIYKNFKLTGTMDSVLCAILIFLLSLYRRRIEKKNIMFLKKQKQNLEAKTFGNFTLMYENKVVKFSRVKSEELIGYLIYKRGSSTKTKELISVLWGDHADSARYGSNLRNLIVDIKHTLADLEIQNFFIAEYNNFRINPEVIKCDYYDFLEGDSKAVKKFAGEFMSQFSWAEEVTGFLEMKALKNPEKDYKM